MTFSLRFTSSRVRAAGLSAAFVLLTGCPDKEEQTASDSDTAAVTDGGTGGNSTTSGATDTPTTTQDGGTMGGTGGMTTGEVMTGGQTDPTAGQTTDGPMGDVTPSCEAACDKIFSCPDVMTPYPDKASCVAGCADSVEGADAACVDANIAMNTCILDYTCAELDDAFNNGNLGKCEAQAAAAEEACAGSVCEGFGGIGENGCSIGKSCPEEPTEEYSCEGDTCTCLVDGVSNGTTCPASGFCDLDYDAQVQAAFDCCGFEL